MGKKGRGFTLIELLVVVAIIAILAAILFPIFMTARDSARCANCLSNMKQIGSAISLYADANDGRVPRYDWGTGANRKMWFDFINPYLKAGRIYRCPSLLDPKATYTAAGPMNRIYGYGVSAGHFFRSDDTWTPPKLDTVPRPSKILIMADAYTWDYDSEGRKIEAGFPVVYCRVIKGPYRHPNAPWQNPKPPYLPDGNVSGRHGGKTNVLFVDMHVKTFATTYVTQEYTTGEDSKNNDIWGHFDMPM